MFEPLIYEAAALAKRQDKGASASALPLCLHLGRAAQPGQYLTRRRNRPHLLEGHDELVFLLLQASRARVRLHVVEDVAELLPLGKVA